MTSWSAQLANASKDDALFGTLHHHLQSFPSRSDGLTFWERCLLKAVASNEGGKTAYTVASVLTLFPEETADPVGDLSLYWTLLQLAEDGLLDGRDAGDPGTYKLRFTLSPLGRRVLGGDANRVTECGYDSWVGGTHVSSEQTMWWFDEGRLVREG